MTTASIALAALRETLFFEGPSRADFSLKKTLRAHPALSNAQRREISEFVMGITVYAHSFKTQLKESERLNPAAYLYLYLLTVAQKTKEQSASVAQFEAFTPKASKNPGALNESFHQARYESLGSECAPCLAHCLTRGPVTLRANTLLNSRDELREILENEGLQTSEHPLSISGKERESVILPACEAKPLSKNIKGKERESVILPACEAKPCGKNALNLNTQTFIRNLSAHKSGRFEVQDAGSQIIAEFCEARPGENILDLCAGNGGKSLALASALNDLGRIDIFDIAKAKLQNALRRAKRAQAFCIREVSQRTFSTNYDCVLVDAPCSQSGTLRRSPDLRHVTMQPRQYCDVQDALLLQASALVKAGGRLVYATCSLFKCENEERVRAFLSSPAGEAFSLCGERTLLPHVHDSDGFYMARLRRV